MDRKRVEALYKTHGGLIFRRAIRLLHDEEEAKAAVQEVFLRVIRSIDDYEEQQKVQHYLFRITTNYCLDQLRKRSRRPRFVEWDLSRTAGTQDPHKDAVVRDLIEKSLESASERTRNVVTMSYVDGMTQDKVAEVMGLSRRTVGRILKRVHKHAQRINSEGRSA